MAGSLAENIGAIVSGEAKPRAVVTYVMAGVTVALLLATTTWATILIRCEPGPACPQTLRDGGHDRGAAAAQYETWATILIRRKPGPYTPGLHSCVVVLLKPSRTCMFGLGELLRASCMHQP